MSDKEWYPEVKDGDTFELPDGTPCRKVGPEWQEKAQATIDTYFPGLKIVRNPEDGRFEIDDKEKFIEMVKARHPDLNKNTTP